MAGGPSDPMGSKSVAAALTLTVLTGLFPMGLRLKDPKTNWNGIGIHCRAIATTCLAVLLILLIGSVNLTRLVSRSAHECR